jgi:hypothetical protein
VVLLPPASRGSHSAGRCKQINSEAFHGFM